MNISKVTDVTNKLVALGYKTGVIQNAPKILLGAGLGMIGGGVVASCKSTLKAQDIISAHKAKREEIQQAIEIAKEDSSVDYTIQAKNKDLATLYFTTGKSLLRTYAVGIGLIGLGTTSILYGFNILDKRYLDSVAAYNALSIAYKKYRKRVREEYGEEVDKQFAQGIYKSDNIISDGKKDKKQTEYDVDFDETASPYMMVYNEDTSTAYIKPGKYYGASARANRLAITEANMSYLIHQQSALTSRLQHDGYLLLNDALDALGMKKLGNIIYHGKKIKAGTIGWVYPTDENGNYCGNGDGYVDFGIFNFEAGLKGSEDWTIVDRMKDDTNVRNPWVVNYKTGDIILDFNVDGDIAEFLPTLTPFRKKSLKASERVAT